MHTTNLIPSKMLPKTEALPRSWQSWIVFATRLVICFLGNYCLSANFGLYEDDHICTVHALHWHWHDFLRALFSSASVASSRRDGRF
jgi:hypothetical protein